MDEIDPDGVLRHDIPAPLALRIILFCAAIFVIVMPTWEFLPAIWPPNIVSPFFLIIIFGAYSIGLPLLVSVFTTPAQKWRVEPGQMTIQSTIPFRGDRYEVFNAENLDHFQVNEIEQMEGANEWNVILVSKSGKRFSSRHFGTRETAEKFKARIETVFNG